MMQPAAQTSQTQKSDGMEARIAALGILNRILEQMHSLAQTLAESRAFSALSPDEQDFCRAVVTITLRRLGQIDDLVARAGGGGAHHNITLSNIMRMSAAQNMFMGVADSLAAASALALVAAAGMGRQKDSIEGILRVIAREGRDWMRQQDEARLNTPDWLLKIWIDDFGPRIAAQIARANLAEAPLDITIRDETERNYWAANLRASEVGTGTLRCLAAAGTEIMGRGEGLLWEQDAAASIPALLFGDIKGKSVLDLCASPDGKTAQLAARGARVTALCRSAQNLVALEKNMDFLRLRDRVEIAASDPAAWKPREAPRYILVNIPSTGTGGVRRNPDILRLRTARDLESLVPVQRRILENAFAILAPGGVLVYSACSLQKAESEDQIAHLVDRHDDAVKIAVKPEEIGGLEEAVTEEGDVRTMPFHRAASGGMDGYFISRIMKAA